MDIFDLKDVMTDTLSNQSAVKVTHIPTGKTVTCDESTSKFKNKKAALRILKDKVNEAGLYKPYGTGKVYEKRGILICEILGNILDLEEGSRTSKTEIIEKIGELQELYRVR